MKKIISKGMVLAVGFASFLALATANAEMPAQPKPLWTENQSAQQSDDQIVKDARRDPNKYCVDCHSSATHTAHTGKAFEKLGKHFHPDTVSPNTGKPLDCTTCHGNISENHRKGVKDVMRFNAYGKAHNKAVERTPQEQNQVCFACHNPEKLRETFWAHDMHANKIACTNCHQLHPEKEPMKATDPKQRVKLCVDCHTGIHERKAKNAAQGNAETSSAKEEK